MEFAAEAVMSVSAVIVLAVSGGREVFSLSKLLEGYEWELRNVNWSVGGLYV